MAISRPLRTLGENAPRTLWKKVGAIQWFVGVLCLAMGLGVYGAAPSQPAEMEGVQLADQHADTGLE